MKGFRKGFTLLEILLVVGIIAVLAGIVIIAINPSKQLATVRNTERKSDLKQVANAINQFYIDKGYYPASTTLSTTTLMTICPTGASSSPAAGFNCTGMVNLSELVPTYIVSIPNDPATTTTSGYSVVLVNKQPAVSAPLAELGVKISVGNVPVGLGRVVQSASSSIQNQWSTWINSDPSNNFPYAINFGSGLFGASSTSNGLDNQNYIIENYTLSNFPSFEYCANLTQGGYDDWYLPAIDELYNSTDPILMYNTFGASTEGDSFTYGLVYKPDNTVNFYDKDNNSDISCTRKTLVYTCSDNTATNYLATSSSPFDCSY